MWRFVLAPATVALALCSDLAATIGPASRICDRALRPEKYRITAKSPASGGADPLRSKPHIIELSENEHKSVQLVLEAREQ